MSVEALRDYYAEESKSFAIGFADWLATNYGTVNGQFYMKNVRSSSNLYKAEELYDIYIKQLK